jgi:hypothetical protein
VASVLVPTWRVWKETGEVLVFPGNLVAFGGASALWELLIGTGFTAFSAANARLGVGDSAEALSPSHTDLQGTSARAALASGYPVHTGTNSAEGTRVVFRSVFAAGVASFAWREVGLFNAATAGRMFNRRVIDAGTKAAGASWTLELGFELAPAPGMS